MPSMITKVPISTGTRSSEAPSSAATPRPTMATSDRLTEAATSVPAMAQTARVLSAPKRRNQRKPYTEATALPMGSEFVIACDAKDSLNSGDSGGCRCPAMSRSYCINVKHT